MSVFILGLEFNHLTKYILFIQDMGIFSLPSTFSLVFLYFTGNKNAEIRGTNLDSFLCSNNDKYSCTSSGHRDSPTSRNLETSGESLSCYVGPTSVVLPSLPSALNFFNNVRVRRPHVKVQVRICSRFQVLFMTMGTSLIELSFRNRSVHGLGFSHRLASSGWRCTKVTEEKVKMHWITLCLFSFVVL